MNESELLQQITQMLGAQLIVEETADVFAFRHALTREAVYATLLLRERKRYHGAIAETLERLYTEGAGHEARLGDIAYHFHAAEQWDKALEYSRRAGERALAVYAPREALTYFTWALDAAQLVAHPTPAPLWHMRGQAHETLGDFDAALRDYEQAREQARILRDGAAEWQSLMDLGFLWAARDYQQAGHYFRLAAELSERLADPLRRAHSLNRLGNWLVNVGQITEAFEAHEDALKIFQAVQDKKGTAESLDLLAMAKLMAGDPYAASENYQNAIALFRELGDKPGLISSLTAGTNVSYFDDTVFTPLPDMSRDAHARAEVLSLAREIGWLAGQAFAEWSIGVSLAIGGEFGAALTHAREALRIATEIGHRQWTAGAYYALGHIYVLLLQPDLAIQNLEWGLPLARDLGSAWWIGNISAYLALAHILKHDLARAESELDAAMPREQRPRSLPERRVLRARGQLALAQGEPAAALQIAEQLIESASGEDKSQPIPMLLLLKGEASIALKRAAEAEQAFSQARSAAEQRGERPLLWQIRRATGKLYQRMKRQAEAEREFAAARVIAMSLAASIDERGLRQAFTRAALETLPKEGVMSPRRAAKEQLGGLTPRERDVAVRIAQGQSNRQIADALVLSERTIESHVSNILSKLGFDARTQIAAWAGEKGLLKPLE